MARGGARVGAGIKPTWKHGKTKTIRVPIALAEAISAFARELDEKGMIECDTNSKVIDLSGISIRQDQGAMSVRLEDLVRAGFILQPDHLAKAMKARLARTKEGALNYGRRL